MVVGQERGGVGAGHRCLCDSDIKARKSITEGHEGEANTCKQYVIKLIYFMLIWIDCLCYNTNPSNVILVKGEL